jgi:hypothetical protein
MQRGESASANAILDDPGSAYTTEVKTALVDAMLDYGTSIPIADNEWLTIAARDNNERIGGDDPYDVTTIVLRVKGSDLAAFKAGRITRTKRCRGSASRTTRRFMGPWVHGSMVHGSVGQWSVGLWVCG